MPISRAVARTIVPWGPDVFGTVCVTAPDAALKSFMVSPAANSDGQARAVSRDLGASRW